MCLLSVYGEGHSSRKTKNCFIIMDARWGAGGVFIQVEIYRSKEKTCRRVA